MMKYTEQSLENALSEIDPESFYIYKDKAELSMPRIMELMLKIGYIKHLRGEEDISAYSRLIILQAYEDLNTGSFKYSEE